MRIAVPSVLAFLLLAAPAVAEEKEMVENPSYAQWAKFKVGAWYRIKVENGSGTDASVMKQTTKLVSRTEEQAVIETSVTIVAGEHEFSQPATRSEIPAKTEKFEVPVEEGENAPKIETKEGTDELTVGGRKIKCRTTETTTETPDLKMWSKSWYSEEVPGGTVRMESKMEKPVESTTTTTLEDFATE
jgi:hypothetical protein